MFAIGLAFARECWGLSRAVWAMTLVYLLALVLLVHAFPAGTFDPAFIASLSFPIWAQALVLIAVFSHGDTADMLARESGYPRRAFTLPVRIYTLVGWPMAIAAFSLALCWLVLAALVLRPGGAPVPLAWPAVFAAAMVVWAQALTWYPFPLVGLRVFVLVPVLCGLGIGAALGAVYHVPPMLLLAVSAGLIPPAYLVALAGVSRARHGDGAVWHWPILERRQAVVAPKPPFASMTDAMFWLDWRRNGFGMPLLFGMCVVPSLLFLRYLHPIPVMGFLSIIGLFPPILVATAGAALGNPSHSPTSSYVIRPFCTARPVTSAAMIAVKLWVALRIFVVTWTGLLLVIVVTLPINRVGPALLAAAEELIAAHGVGLLVAGILALLIFNAKAMVDHLCIGLSGRIWITIAFWAAIGAGMIAVGWIVSHPDWHEDLLALVPLLIGAALVLKLAAGGLVGWMLARHALVPRPVLGWYAAGWVVAAAALAAAALWLTPPELASPPVVAMAAVLLLLPMVRLGLAPLALDWNRHR